MSAEQQVQRWVKKVEALCQPSAIQWCTGSQEEYNSLCNLQVANGTFIPLNERLRPNSFLCRTDVSDVEFDSNSLLVCSKSRSDCSQARQWAEPETTRNEINKLILGSMKGRTLYVVPYILGPVNSSMSRLGVTLTDSPFVVVQSMIMTTVGTHALSLFPFNANFLKIVHSVGQPLSTGGKDSAWPCNIRLRKTAIFPEELYAVQYGVSCGVQDLVAFLSSALAQKEGWISAKGLFHPSALNFAGRGMIPS